MLRYPALILALSLGTPGTGAAQQTETKQPKVSVSAPLLLMHGPPKASDAVAQAMRDIARRDGSAFIDLSLAPLSPPSAPAELRHAVAAYQEFDYGRAMKHLSAAMDEVKSSGARGLSNAELCDLFMYRALVRNAQGNSSAAWDDFVQAALIDPTRHLDAVRFSPSVAASFERARQEIGNSTAISLKVKASPKCTLFVDAQDRGLESAVTLRPGRHFIRVACPGYRSYSDVLLLHTDQTATPLLVEEEVPSPAEILAMAKERGFRHVLFAQIPLVPPANTVLFSLFDRAGKELGRTSMSLGEAAEDRGLAVVAMSRLLDVLTPVVAEPRTVKEERSWYESPWIWATAGVAVTTAILLPFALRDQQSAGFGVELGGAAP